MRLTTLLIIHYFVLLSGLVAILFSDLEILSYLFWFLTISYIISTIAFFITRHFIKEKATFWAFAVLLMLTLNVISYVLGDKKAVTIFMLQNIFKGIFNLQIAYLIYLHVVPILFAIGSYYFKEHIMSLKKNDNR